MKKLIFACLMIFGMNSYAEFISGNKLLSLMTSKSEVENGVAYGYVAGVFDLGHGVTHCAPNTILLRQVYDMTLRTLQNVPEYREKSADQYVLATIQNAWPCKGKTPGGKTI